MRLALGVGTRGVMAMVMRSSLRLVALGAVIGLAAAFAVTRLLSGLLYRVAPIDPLTFIAVPALLGAVAMLASFLPARRATRVDPVVALRAE